jgi:hypothetical protein
MGARGGAAGGRVHPRYAANPCHGAATGPTRWAPSPTGPVGWRCAPCCTLSRTGPAWRAQSRRLASSKLGGSTAMLGVADPGSPPPPALGHDRSAGRPRGPRRPTLPRWCPREDFALASFIPRWAASRGPAVLGTFPAFGGSGVVGAPGPANPVGQAALWAAAAGAAPPEWSAPAHPSPKPACGRPDRPRSVATGTGMACGAVHRRAGGPRMRLRHGPRVGMTRGGPEPPAARTDGTLCAPALDLGGARAGRRTWAGCSTARRARGQRRSAKFSGASSWDAGAG